MAKAPVLQTGNRRFESSCPHMDRKDYDLARYYRLKSEYIQLLGGKCVKCNSLESLDFDHIDPKTKCFDIGQNMFRPREVVLAELKKCQLLCRTCHNDKTHQRKVGHGEGKTGMRNCYCSLCKPLKQAYMKIYRKTYRRLS